MMYNFESNTGLFAVCIVLMLMTITKWYNLVHLDELPEYKRSMNYLRAHAVIVPKG